MKKKIFCVILIIIILQYFCIFVFADNSLNSELTNEIANIITNEIPEELQAQKEEIDKNL